MQHYRIFASLVHQCYNISEPEQEVFMGTDKARYTVSVDQKMFQEIEDFRFENRYQTRAEATVELIRLGLQTVHEKKNQKSRKD
jgi:hypothetical protein